MIKYKNICSFNSELFKFTSDEINYRLERAGANNVAYRLGRTFPRYLTDKTSIVFVMRGEDGLVLRLNGSGTEFVMSLNNPNQNPSFKRGLLFYTY